jgi:hypothetical protein
MRHEENEQKGEEEEEEEETDRMREALYNVRQSSP